MDWTRLLSSKRSGKKEVPQNQSRSAFEQDFDRIIFSHPFRKLQDKTQVFPLPEHDFVHTRLTHSLEVSSVGRSLGRKAGSIIIERYPELATRGFTEFDFGAIVAAASLAHDLGNPPFGHAGEQAISGFFSNHEKGARFQEMVDEAQWADLVDFEGNAQGFRILTNSEFEGLKLTNATLAAFSKYPRPSQISNPEEKRRSQKKYGFFQTEKSIFREVAEEAGLIPGDTEYVWRRHPLTFLVETADDICYLIIDLEDGCRLGLVSFQETLELLAGIMGDKLNEKKLNSIGDLNERLGLLRAITIGILIDQVATCFLDHEGEILNGIFDNSLTDEIQASHHIKEISRISIEKIYRSQKVVEIETAGYEVLPGLLAEFAYAAVPQAHANQSGKHESLSRLFPVRINQKLGKFSNQPYQQLRLCLDFISGMTDRYALSVYRKIKGISLPS